MTSNTLNDLHDKVKALLPLPKDFAVCGPEPAAEILERMQKENTSFFELSAADLQLSFQLSALCDDDSFLKLCAAFKERVTLALFKTGWIYCQYHPDEKKAVKLFSISCDWAKTRHEKEYSKTLIGKTGFPWEQIYSSSIDIIHSNNLSVKEFCEKFGIITDTPFYTRLLLTWFSRCEKNIFTENEALFSELILSTDALFLRTAISNYFAQVPFENIGRPIYSAILYRMDQGENGEALGISPLVLQKIRRQRFNSLIAELMGQRKEKQAVYSSVSDRIRSIEQLAEGFISIDFGSYLVVDCEKWASYAYAFEPALYKGLYEMWGAKGFPPDFWPGIEEKEIAGAYDVVLGIKKSGAVTLNFTGFDALYVKDLLNSNK